MSGDTTPACSRGGNGIGLVPAVSPRVRLPIADPGALEWPERRTACRERSRSWTAATTTRHRRPRTCTGCRGALQEYLDGTLDKTRSLEVFLHLRDCAPCQAEHDRAAGPVRPARCPAGPAGARGLRRARPGLGSPGGLPRHGAAAPRPGARLPGGGGPAGGLVRAPVLRAAGLVDGRLQRAGGAGGRCPGRICWRRSASGWCPNCWCACRRWRARWPSPPAEPRVDLVNASRGQVRLPGHGPGFGGDPILSARHFLCLLLLTTLVLPAIAAAPAWSAGAGRRKRRSSRSRCGRPGRAATPCSASTWPRAPSGIP